MVFIEIRSTAELICMIKFGRHAIEQMLHNTSLLFSITHFIGASHSLLHIGCIISILQNLKLHGLI